MEDSSIDGHKHEEPVGRETLKVGLVGVVAHSLLCPLDGIIPLAVKCGLISTSIAAPLYVVHHEIVHTLSDVLICCGTKVNDAEGYAHTLVDYGAMSLAVGFPAYVLGKGIYKWYHK